MPNIRVVKSVLSEYGTTWAVNRILYSAKLTMMSAAPFTDTFFEKQTPFPKRLDLFDMDVEALCLFLRENLSGNEKGMLISAADKACKGVITGFSSIELNYGYPVDWQLNPLEGKRCNENVKWYKIPDFDTERGDIKVIWEASRFSHFVTFARAYLVTGDDKYYKAFSDQLHNWLAKNPYSFGANFKCSQECSLRMINALLAYTVFKACGVVESANTGDMKHLVNRCYRKALSNFFYAYKCIRNNHTISELMGMIVGAWCSQDNKRLAYAYKTLDEVINEQFTSDGGYRQFSFNYQRLALQDLEVILSISKKTGHSLNNESLKKIRKAAELMFQCCDDSGDMPNYGSNDGALVFPVTSCGYRDFRPVINTTYALCTGKQLYEGGSHQEELIWFGSGKSLKDYDVKCVERISSKFPEAGLFTMRSTHSWAMIVTNDYKSRPAHMDQLHFDLWINGINVFCDAGTYSYARDDGRRLIQNESHNTALIEAASQMNAYGPFMICDWTKRRLEKFENDVFEGAVISANRYIHKRKVEIKKNGYVIQDQVNKDAFILFHTPCDVETKGDEIELLNSGRRLCVIRSGKKADIKESMRSLYYLKGEKISCIVFKVKANEKLKTTIKV